MLVLFGTVGLGVLDPARAKPESPEFRAVRLSGSATLDHLKRTLGEAGLTVLQKVNRRDLRHMGKGVVLQVPQGPGGLLEFSPFPARLEVVKALEKTILVSLRVQAFAAYGRGRLVNWGPVCTGTRKQATPPGLYHTNWKARRKVSTINSSWVMPWYYNLHTSMGVAFHQYALPGKPSSYGCIRLLREDAVWIYRWAEPGEPSEAGWAEPRVYGTPVVVFGEYDYDSDPPWTRLAEDPSAANADLNSVETAIARYAWALQTRNNARIREIAPDDGRESPGTRR